MKAIGQLLREAREEKGITLQEISKETKIQERHLHALEEGDFSTFAGQIYLKGALRNYANAVGIDDSEIIIMFEQSQKQETLADGKRKSKGDDPKKTEVKEKVIKEKDKYFYHREKKNLSTGAIVWILLLAVIVTGSLWYGYRQSALGDTELPNNEHPRVENEEVDPGNEEEPLLAEVEIPEEPHTSPSIDIVQQDGSDIHYLLKDVDVKEVLLVFEGQCWARIEQDGNLLEETTYSSGDSKQLGDAQETTIRLGAPPHAILEVNDIELDDFREASNPVNIVIEKEK